MRTNLKVEKEIVKTRDACARVWPIICPDKADRFYPIEGTDDKASKAFDTAGIDWVYDGPEGLIGISQRTQYMPRGIPPYNTFSVRISRVSGCNTEWQKRVSALVSDADLLTPSVTIQNYFSEDGSRLLSSGRILTCDLIASLLAGPPMRYHTNPQDGTKFVTPSWESLQSNRCPVKVWTPPLALAA
jgi:hypothetical protein